MKAQRDYIIAVTGEKGGAIGVSIAGRLALESLHELMSTLEGVLEERLPSTITIDLAGVEYMDSAGALLLAMVENKAISRSIPLSFVNISAAAKGIMGLLNREALAAAPIMPEKRSTGFFEQVGEASLLFFNDLIQVITFVGELLMGLAYSVRHPRSVRWGDVLVYMERVGVDGFPIVALISFLLGLIIAFMSSLQLRQFGANIYIASLVGVAMVRELGPIMTALLVAGRSGSAFAAEIGTMKVNEEVDALAVMGFDPTRFLAVPKVIAAMAMMPLLTIFANLLGIGGGLMVCVALLDLTVAAYVQQTLSTMLVFDIVSGLVKSVVFALLIAGIGSQRGFRVRGGAEAVGRATTSAVVSAMFLIIVVDSVFAIVLHYVG